MRFSTAPTLLSLGITTSISLFQSTNAFVPFKHLTAYEGPAKFYATVEKTVDDDTSPSSSADADIIDDPTEDPWVLRSVTFSCLDGSPSSPNPQLLADFLMETGVAVSTSITDHDRDTELESPIFREPGEENNVKPAVICGDAAVGTNVWNRCDVNCHIPATIDIVQLSDTIRETFNLAVTPRYTVDEIPDVDWVVKVQSSWKPIVLDGMVLKFPWHKEEDVREAIMSAETGDGTTADTENKNVVGEYQQITLQGGIAFGTGEHPTTRLCLKYLRNAVSTMLAEKDDDNKDNLLHVLDYGSGSGVLGLAACSLSSQVRAYGVDIDADAVAIANVNSEINDLPMISYLPPNRMTDDEASLSMMLRAANAAAAATGKTVEPFPPTLGVAMYDICAANILAGPLIGLSQTLANLVKPGGKIGLSGILGEPQAETVVEAYSKYFDGVQVEEIENDWCLVTGTRKQ